MNKRALASFLVLGAVLNMNIAFAAPNYAVQKNVPTYTPQYGQSYAPQQYGQSYSPQTYVAPLQGRVSVVPAGSCIPTITTSEISSATLTLGQSISVALGNDYYYNGQLIAPAGSQVNGNVIMVRKGGRAGKNGQLQVRFTNILTPYGQNIPISGKIRTDDGSGILYAATAKDTTKAYAKDLAIGSASGAVLGTAIGAIAGGTGRGAWGGTAIGAGLGLGKSLIDKGVDVEIPANSNIDVVIDQPITVNSTPRY